MLHQQISKAASADHMSSLVTAIYNARQRSGERPLPQGYMEHAANLPTVALSLDCDEPVLSFRHRR